MSCRYFDHVEHRDVCTACDPLREPSRGEQKALCQAAEQRACAFYRFRKATGRALLMEDFLAWQRQRADAEPFYEPEAPAGEPL